MNRDKAKNAAQRVRNRIGMLDGMAAQRVTEASSKLRGPHQSDGEQRELTAEREALENVLRHLAGVYDELDELDEELRAGTEFEEAPAMEEPA